VNDYKNENIFLDHKRNFLHASKNLVRPGHPRPSARHWRRVGWEVLVN